MKRPSEHDYGEIQEISRLSSEFIDSFYWNEDKIKAFDIASKIVKYIDFYIKDYNITINDLLIRNECQENSDRHQKHLEESIKKLDEILPKLKLTDEGDSKLCYSLTELQDPKMFQESLDTLNNLDVNGFTGEVKLKNRSRRRLR